MKYIIVSLLCIIAFLIFKYEQLKSQSSKDDFDDLLMHHMKEGVGLHELIYKNNVAVDYRFLKVNKSFEEITGLKSHQILGKTAKVILPDLESTWIEKYADIVENKSELIFENYSKALNKRFRVYVFTPSEGKFVTVFTDVTKEHEEFKKIKMEKALTQTTLNSLGDGVISSDINCNIEMMNSEAERMTGWSLEEVKGKPFCDFFSIYDTVTNQQIECPVKNVMTTKKVYHLDGFASLKTRDNILLPIEDSIAPILNEEGNAMGVVVVFHDNSEKIKRIEKIKYLSYHDQLTGVYNRHFYEAEIRRLDVKRNLPLSLLMLDVNGLKLTNDAFGHLAGDELLKKVATILQEVCRSDEIIARIGGDEFVLLLPKTDGEAAEELVKRLYSKFENIVINSVKVSVSIGWATKYSESDLVDDIFVQAEEFMYKRKISESRSMRNATVKTIIKTLHESNPFESRHSKAVSKLVVQIGEALNMDGQEIKELELAGELHDIGKIVIDKDLLAKKEKIKPEEFLEMKRHVEVGYQILKSVEDYSDLATYVLSHHEKWDGSGYPNKLCGKDIPLYSRIIAVADSFDVMTNKEYGKKMSVEEAILQLEHLSGVKYDPEIVDKFVGLFSAKKDKDANNI